MQTISLTEQLSEISDKTSWPFPFWSPQDWYSIVLIELQMAAPPEVPFHPKRPAMTESQREEIGIDIEDNYLLLGGFCLMIP